MQSVPAASPLFSKLSMPAIPISPTSRAVAVALALVGAMALHADSAWDPRDSWSLSQAGPLKIYADGPAAEAAELLQELHAFRQAIRTQVMGFEEAELERPHDILLIRQAATLRRFGPIDPQGNLARADGFFLSSQFNPIALLSPGRRRSDLRRIAYHELAHGLIQSALGPMPAWAEEGMAELFANIEIGQAELTLGARPRFGSAATRSFDARELFAANENPIFKGGKAASGLSIDAFYEQAHALAHYAFFTQDGRYWRHYLKLARLSNERPVVERDVMSFLDRDFDALSADVAEHAKTTRRFRGETWLRESPEGRDIDRRAAPPSLILALQARALARGGRLAEAEVALSAASELRDEDPAWRESLVELRLRQDRRAEAGQAAWRARAMGSDDPFVWSLASLHAAAGRVDGLDPTDRQQAERLLSYLESAYSMGGRSRALFETYYSIIASAGLAIAEARLDFLWQSLDYHQNLSYRRHIIRLAADRAFESGL